MSDRWAGCTGETDDALALLWATVDSGQVEMLRTGPAGHAGLLVPLAILVPLAVALTTFVGPFVDDPAPLVLLAVVTGVAALVAYWRLQASRAAWVAQLRNDPVAFETEWRAGDLALAWTATVRPPVPRADSVENPADWRLWLSGWLCIPLRGEEREPAEADPFAHALLWRLHDAGRLTIELGPAVLPRDLPQDHAAAVAALRASPRAFARAFASCSVTIELRWPRDIILRTTERFSGEARWGAIVRRFARQAHFRDATRREPPPVRDGREFRSSVDAVIADDAFLALAEAVRQGRVAIEPPEPSGPARWLPIIAGAAAYLGTGPARASGQDAAGWVLLLGAVLALAIVPAWRRRRASRSLRPRILAEQAAIDRAWRQGQFQLRWHDGRRRFYWEFPVARHPADWRRWIVMHAEKARW